jgi:hypothetical protein
MDEQSLPESSLPQEEKTPRRSRARERHQRRKERQTGMVQPLAAPRQIAPKRSYQMPSISISIPASIKSLRYAVYAAAGLAFVVAVIFILGRLRNNTPQSEPNAIWLGDQWTYAPREANDVSGLAAKMRDGHIGTVYAWVALLRPNAAWSDTSKFGGIKPFVQQMRAAYPTAKLYGWLSVGSQNETGGDRLSDPNIQQMVADLSARIVGEFGFDGVFLNVVPIKSGDENFLTLLRKIRASLGDNVPLSVAVPPDWTPTDAGITLPPRIAPGTVWDDPYKQRVALLADQIAVMAFNTGFTSPGDYSAWVAYQLKTYTKAIATLDTSTELIIGLPTYNQLPDHDPNVENILTGTQGVKSGLIQASDTAKFFKGVGLYAEWETDSDEWSQLHQWAEAN